MFGTAALKCQIGCGNSSITDTPILKCTSFSAINDWAIGEDKIIASIPKTEVYAASYTGSAWLALQKSTGSDWEVRITLDTTTRYDTGKINTSPSEITWLIKLHF